MKVLVSACLLGENCKYNGGNNYNSAVCGICEGQGSSLYLPGDDGWHGLPQNTY